ncbi:MAG: putative rane protein [Herbinix sp.]|jgi:hypothetical protein|nr:putative rane protein [Herbinix sp.]
MITHKGGSVMMEKIYHTMKSVGVWNLVLGILTIIAGAVAGTLLILNGSRLLKKKSELMF